MDQFDELLLRLIRTSEPYSREKLLKQLYKINMNDIKKSSTPSFYEPEFDMSYTPVKPKIDVLTALKEIKKLT
jgi:hypothetical protein